MEKVIVEMNEAEYKLYQSFISESNLDDKVNIPNMVSELESYIQKNGIEPKNDEELVAACNQYLTDYGYESLVDTEVVEEILNYVDSNYA